MAQSSGPIATGTDAERQFSDVLWRNRFGDEPGVLGDLDGTAYALTVTGADTYTVGSTTQDSLATVAGFVHKVPSGSPEPITIPAAVGATRTDIIALRYDPAFTGSPGPVRLTRIAGSSAAIPAYDNSPPGVEDLPLFAVTRAVGQTLSQATVLRMYPRIGRLLELPAGSQAPTSSPLGSVLWLGDSQYRRKLVSGSPAWSLVAPPNTDIAFNSFTSQFGWTARSGAGYEVRNGWVQVDLNHTMGSWSGNNNINQLPVGARPARTKYFNVNWAGEAMSEVHVNTDGFIVTTDGGTSGLVGGFSFPVA